MYIGGTVISSVEFHGNMSLVIFMSKCPLACRYCHNVELLEDESEKTFEEVKEEIDSSFDFLDAVVISGGEPLVQTDEVIEIENSAGKNTPENCLRRIDSMQQHWQEICEQLKTMPSAEYLMNLLKEIGCPYLPSAIGIDAATLKDTFLYCKEVRARYTVFQTVYDLGLLDELSDGVQLRLNRIEEKA